MFRRLFGKAHPALILTRSLEPFPELMEMAVKHKRTILRSKEDTSLFIPNFTDWLKARLSPRITRHGVLVDVYGEGSSSWGSPAWARARPPWSW